MNPGLCESQARALVYCPDKRAQVQGVVQWPCEDGQPESNEVRFVQRLHRLEWDHLERVSCNLVSIPNHEVG